MKLNPKAYFIDLDGTSFDVREDGRSKISETNKKAIIETNKKTPVIISTGRQIDDTLPILKELGLDYGICQSGAQIINSKGEILEQNNFSSEIAETIFKIIVQKKLMFKPNDVSILYGARFPFGIIARTVGFKTCKTYDFKKSDQYSKIVIFGSTKKRMAKLAELFREKFSSLSIVSSGNGYTIEITSDKATKGIANVKVAKLLKLNPLETVHIGDSMNDSTTHGKMILIAMANSNPKLIKMADWVGPHYKRAGLSKILLNNDIKKSV